MAKTLKIMLTTLLSSLLLVACQKAPITSPTSTITSITPSAPETSSTMLQEKTHTDSGFSKLIPYNAEVDKFTQFLLKVNEQTAKDIFVYQGEAKLKVDFVVMKGTKDKWKEVSGREGIELSQNGMIFVDFRHLSASQFSLTFAEFANKKEADFSKFVQKFEIKNVKCMITDDWSESERNDLSDSKILRSISIDTHKGSAETDYRLASEIFKKAPNADIEYVFMLRTHA